MPNIRSNLKENFSPKENWPNLWSNKTRLFCYCVAIVCSVLFRNLNEGYTKFAPPYSLNNNKDTVIDSAKILHIIILDFWSSVSLSQKHYFSLMFSLGSKCLHAAIASWAPGVLDTLCTTCSWRVLHPSKSSLSNWEVIHDYYKNIKLSP